MFEPRYVAFVGVAGGFDRDGQRHGDVAVSSVVTAYEYGKVDIIANSDNERITPSVILFEEDEVIVGKIAKNQAVSNPENVVQFISSG